MMCKTCYGFGFVAGLPVVAGGPPEERPCPDCDLHDVRMAAPDEEDSVEADDRYGLDRYGLDDPSIGD